MGCDAANPDYKSPQATKVSHTVNKIDVYQGVTFNAKGANYQTDIVVDSGSAISIMSSELCELINRHSKTPLEIQPCSIKARTATGENLSIIGKTTVELDLGDSIWYVDCYVIRNFKYSFLLGSDFLIKSCASLDLGSMCIKLGQQSLHVSAVKQPTRIPICAIETLEIPARSEALLTGSVTGLKGNVLVEPKYEVVSHDSLLFPAHCLANVTRGQIPIRIANANLSPVKIHAGTCVGMAEIIDNSDYLKEKGKMTSDSSTSWIDNSDLSKCRIN